MTIRWIAVLLVVWLAGCNSAPRELTFRPLNDHGNIEDGVVVFRKRTVSGGVFGLGAETVVENAEVRGTAILTVMGLANGDVLIFQKPGLRSSLVKLKGTRLLVVAPVPPPSSNLAENLVRSATFDYGDAMRTVSVHEGSIVDILMVRFSKSTEMNAP